MHLYLIFQTVVEYIRDANLFRNPVTNDIAPGYEEMILKPMDLGAIKKMIEVGVRPSLLLPICPLDV